MTKLIDDFHNFVNASRNSTQEGVCFFALNQNSSSTYHVVLHHAHPPPPLSTDFITLASSTAHLVRIVFFFFSYISCAVSSDKSGLQHNIFYGNVTRRFVSIVSGCCLLQVLLWYFSKPSTDSELSSCRLYTIVLYQKSPSVPAHERVMTRFFFTLFTLTHPRWTKFGCFLLSSSFILVNSFSWIICLHSSLFVGI